MQILLEALPKFIPTFKSVMPPREEAERAGHLTQSCDSLHTALSQGRGGNWSPAHILLARHTVSAPRKAFSVSHEGNAPTRAGLQQRQQLYQPIEVSLLCLQVAWTARANYILSCAVLALIFLNIISPAGLSLSGMSLPWVIPFPQGAPLGGSESLCFRYLFGSEVQSKQLWLVPSHLRLVTIPQGVYR